VDFSGLTVTPAATVRDAITAIDRAAQQIVLVVEDGILLGAVSDGDVRRGLLRGVGLDAAVTEVMNPDPARVGVDAAQEQIDRLKTERGIRHVPVVDADGRLVDVVGHGERIAVAITTPVVLMAGGRGQRLYPITRDIPKPMVPIGGIPMIEVIARRLRAQGFRRMHVSVNYLGHLIEEHLGDGSALGLEVTYLHETSPLGTAGALAQLDGEIDEPFVVMNSDLLTDVDLRSMLAFHRSVADGGTVGVREYGFEIPFGVVQIEGDVVVGLAEKPEHRELVSAGIYILEPAALSLLERETYTDMPTLLAQLIDTGRTVGGYLIREDWIDVGRPEDLERARAAVLRSGL
jgi:dTDP-glucose pyrophosphorylase